MDWNGKTGSELKAIHKTRPGILKQDKYALAVRSNDVTVEHEPKIFIEINVFYLKHGGDLLVRIGGADDLNQGGMELSATYTFTSADARMHSPLIKLVAKAMEGYNKIRNETDTEQKKKATTMK